MVDPEKLERWAKTSLMRLRPRLEKRFAGFARKGPADWRIFLRRLEENYPPLFEILLRLYGEQYDFFYHLEDLLSGLAQSWIERSSELKALDAHREANPTWFHGF
jgi:hypothetical protein